MEQNYTEIVNGDVSLTVENGWHFKFLSVQGARMFCLLYIFSIYLTINLHFTSHKNIGKKTHTQTKKITGLPDTNIPESTSEYKITNNNNKHICRTENWGL